MPGQTLRTAPALPDRLVETEVKPLSARPRSAWRTVFAGTAALAFVAAIGWLGYLERGGPAHVDLELPGGIPATFYVQGPSSPFGLPEAPPLEARPPGIVLCHGFSADRAMTSTLARRFAANGYAVLAIDARGHGQNRNRFDGAGDGSGLHDDFAQAVHFLRTSPYVDGNRIAVVGHSMGAGAALDYATRDPDVRAAVMISGGFRMNGPHRPPNSLFIYAEHDPANLRRASDVNAARLADSARDPADFTGRTAVKGAMVPGTDHLTILWSREAASEIVSWLDRSFGVAPRIPVLADPRLAAAGVGFACYLLLLPVVGWAIGRFAPACAAQEARGWPRRLAGLGLVLFAVLPLSGTHVITAPIRMQVAEEATSLFLLAGVIIIAAVLLLAREQVTSVFSDYRAAGAAAAFGWVVVAAAMTPLGVVVHRLALTPERFGTAAFLTAACLPLYLALEILLRRGSAPAAAATSAAGRILVLAVLFFGAAIGMLPWVINLMLPVVALIFFLGEIVAWPVYTISGNRLAIALVQSAWFGWLVAATMATRL